MCDATQAEKHEGPTPAQLAQRERFDRLYCDWHTGRAATNNPDLPEDEPSMNARARRLDEVERALLTTPAPVPFCVWMKWECLDQLMIDEAEFGMNTDNRVLVAVAAIKADVLRFGSATMGSTPAPDSSYRGQPAAGVISGAGY